MSGMLSNVVLIAATPWYSYRAMINVLSRSWLMFLEEFWQESISENEIIAFTICEMPSAPFFKSVTTRIILSGKTDSVSTTEYAAHHLLSKPCNITDLMQAIDEAQTIARSQINFNIKEKLRQPQALPSPPYLLTQINHLLNTPNVTLAELSTLIEEDSSISAKVLQMINSPFSKTGTTVADINHAINLLGITHIKTLILKAHLMTELKMPNIFSAFHSDLLWNQSNQTASLAYNIAKQSNTSKDTPMTCFTAGLLLDVGMALMAVEFPSMYQPTCLHALANNTYLHETEHTCLRVNHGEIGSHLLSHLKLPPAIIETVKYHHSPNQIPQAYKEVGLIVHAADAISTCCHNLNKNNYFKGYFDKTLLNKHYSDDTIRQWCNLSSPDDKNELWEQLISNSPGKSAA